LRGGREVEEDRTPSNTWRKTSGACQRHESIEKEGRGWEIIKNIPRKEWRGTRETGGFGI